MRVWVKLIMTPFVWVIPWPICAVLVFVCMMSAGLGVLPRVFNVLLVMCAIAPLVWVGAVIVSRLRLGKRLRAARWMWCPKCHYPLESDAARVVVCPECGARSSPDQIRAYWKGMLGEQRSKTGAGCD
jgi:hypothetical protein